MKNTVILNHMHAGRAGEEESRTREGQSAGGRAQAWKPVRTVRWGFHREEGEERVHRSGRRGRVVARKSACVSNQRFFSLFILDTKGKRKPLVNKQKHRYLGTHVLEKKIAAKGGEEAWLGETRTVQVSGCAANALMVMPKLAKIDRVAKGRW